MCRSRGHEIDKEEFWDFIRSGREKFLKPAPEVIIVVPHDTARYSNFAMRSRCDSLAPLYSYICRWRLGWELWHRRSGSLPTATKSMPSLPFRTWPLMPISSALPSPTSPLLYASCLSRNEALANSSRIWRVDVGLLVLWPLQRQWHNGCSVWLSSGMFWVRTSWSPTPSHRRRLFRFGLASQCS